MTDSPNRRPHGTHKSGERTKRALLVCGVHRSGTSAFTRVLNLLGADLPGRLMPPVPGDNDPGFWEPKDISRIHDDVFDHLGSKWSDPLPFAEDHLSPDVTSRFEDRILEVLTRDFSKSDLFVIKDPRISRLVPMWRRILQRFGAEVSYLIPFRNPLEVAASLERRDGFTYSHSTLLWLRYVLESERETREAERSFASYDRLLQDWRTTVEKIESDLDLTWPRRPEQVAEAVESFLSPTHRRFTIGTDRISSAREPSWLTEAFDALEAGARGNEAEMTSALDELGSRLKMADLPYSRLLRQTLERKADETESAFRARAAERMERTRRRQAEDSASAAEARLQQLRSQSPPIIPLAEARKVIETFGVWDPEHYAKQLDEGLSDDPLDHFLRYAAADPHPLFDVAHYSRKNFDAISGGWNPLAHFLLHGVEMHHLRDPHPLFDSAFVLRAQPELAESRRNPWITYLETGGRDFDPHPLFDTSWYLANHPPASDARTPLEHFVGAGIEGREPHPLFDPAHYRLVSDQPALSDAECLADYLHHGHLGLFDPHPGFSVAHVLRQRPDLFEAEVDPLRHYIEYGTRERGTDPHPDFDNDAYLEEHPELIELKISPLLHALQYPNLSQKGTAPVS